MLLLTETAWTVLSHKHTANQTIDRTFETLRRVFNFLFRLEMINRVFEKLGKIFQNLSQEFEKLSKYLKDTAACFEANTRQCFL